MEAMVYAISFIQAQNARSRSRSRSHAPRDEQAFYARPHRNLKDLAHVAATVGGIALYAGLLGMIGQ